MLMTIIDFTNLFKDPSNLSLKDTGLSLNYYATSIIKHEQVTLKKGLA